MASFLQQLSKGLPQSQLWPLPPAAAPEQDGEGCRVRAANQEMGSSSSALRSCHSPAAITWIQDSVHAVLEVLKR